MAASFFFYDLETSGFSPRSSRVMQFGGQRTDMELQPIGEPVNVLIKLSEDVVPDPDAILITGITPQRTLSEGVSEVEFLKLFTEQVATPDTIFVGFNSLRFDDEFMRYLLYRNFYDPYEWQWQDGRSRWDLLDMVRMMRALRPDGIQWPFDSEGKPSNRLELLSGLNKLDHQSAHDALSDVGATIALARLIRGKQPKLFDFLLSLRDKKKVAVLVGDGEPFVYTSGKYPSEFEKTTVAVAVTDHPKQGGVLVYDLRHDPAPFAKLSPEQLAKLWQYNKDESSPRLPVKTLKYNHCPAVAPLSVLDRASQERLKLDMKVIEQNHKALAEIPEWPKNLLKALEILDKQQQTRLLSTEHDVDAQLYDGFFGDGDRQLEQVVRAATSDELRTLAPDFRDQRLVSLLPLYKARNFPASLTDQERSAWEGYREQKLLGGGTSSRLAKYFERLGELDSRADLKGEQRYILEELQLWGQSIMPVSGDAG